MKKSKTVALLICICILLSAMVGGLSGCATVITAEELTRGFAPQAVEHAELDALFFNAQTRFSTDLLRACLETGNGNNLLISPLSVQLALAMTANGANGETREQLEALFGGLSVERLNAYLHTYTSNLPTPANGLLRCANSLWLREGLSANPDFLQTNVSYYGAQVYRTAFDARTVKDINNWCRHYTNGTVDEIVDRIDTNTMMYLLNALLFEAEWKTVYEASHIKKGSFYAQNGTAQSVDMMHSAETHGFRMSHAYGFRKDYKGGAYSFVGILPDNGVSLLDCELPTREQLNERLGVAVALPKFSYDCSVDLRDPLSALGVTAAFDPSFADFGGMVSDLGDANANEAASLYIEKALHKTHITVDAKGTRAGAVTSIAMNKGSSPDLIPLVFDRPFLYMIVDNTTGLPLLMGAVTEIP